MAVTNSEEALRFLNYSYTSRASMGAKTSSGGDSYKKALEAIVNIYSKKVERNEATMDEIDDFQQHISTVNYLDNSELYPGIEQVPQYSKEVLDNAIMVSKSNDFQRVA